MKNASPSSSPRQVVQVPTDDEQDDGDNGDGEPKERIKRLDRNRDELLYDDNDDQPNEAADRKLKRDRDAREARVAQEKAKEEKKIKAKQEATKDKKADSKAIEEKKNKAKEDATKDKKADNKASTSRTEDRTSDRFKDFLNDDVVPTTPVAGPSRKRLSTPPPVRTETPCKKKRNDKTAKNKKTKTKPFQTLLNGVVLVISGIQVIYHLDDS